MDEILCHNKEENEDYYKILSCDETSTTEQILTEYKTLSLLHHPDKNPDDKDSVIKFQKLQKAKDVLTDPEKRALYDKWRCSGFCISYEKFLNLNKASHTVSNFTTKFQA
ncbi:J domain-containing protein-like [Uloborus diversus]|uniref:J domain-containing protein-like n=1 Tax=Uloborus diversus TaxID=327109 RepID=UPI002409BCD9|nr:J domain-containing protein-like [Uloborus diversus]